MLAGISVRPVVIVLLAGIGLAGPTPAQPSSTAALVLELPSSARALALGDAFVAIGNDEAAIFYNPAQLASLRGSAAGLSVQQYLASSTLAAAAAAMPIGPGTLGVGLQVLDYGSGERVIIGPGGPVPTGETVTAGDYVALLAYGIETGRVRVGVTGKFIAQRLASLTGTTGAVDVGAAVDVGGGATLGLALQNVGGDIALGASSAPLPRMIRAGAAVPLGDIGPVAFAGSVEMSKSLGEDPEPSGGLELAWRAEQGVTVLGRIGALALPEGTDMNPLSFGGGVRARSLSVDYAYQSFDTFGGTHRVGVRWWR